MRGGNGIYIMRKTTYLRLFLCLALSGQTGLFAQDDTERILDSLKTELAFAFTDTQRADLLQQIVLYYGDYKAEEGITYIPALLELAALIDDPHGLAMSKGLAGRLYWRIGDFDTALRFHFQARDVYSELKDSFGLARVLTYIGQDYADGGNYPEAMNYFRKALNMYELLDNIEGQSNIYGLFSWVFEQQGNLIESVHYNREALRICEEIGDTYGMAIYLSNLGNTHLSMDQYDKALEYYQRSIPMMEKRNDFINVGNTYMSIGYAYMLKGELEDAIVNTARALQTGEQIQDKYIIGKSHHRMGEILESQQQWAKALEHYVLSARSFEANNSKQMLAESLAKVGSMHTRLSQLPLADEAFERAAKILREIDSEAARMRYYGGLEALDSARGRWRDAYRHHKAYILLRDKIHNDENTRQIMRTTLQYEFDRKEAAAKAEEERREALAREELQRQKLVRNGFVGGFAVMMAFAGIFWFQRNKIKKGKQLSDSLLLNILPAEIAEELKRDGRSEARLCNEVTVMFADIQGFTRIAEKLSPKDLVGEIDTCFKAFDTIISKYGIEKIKTIGDAYMAAGGLPVPADDSVKNTVLAALDMQAFIRAHKAENEASGKPAFDMRVGIHTGPVVAGIVGVKKFQYDIWGDTVNTASRMETSGVVGKVNISEATYKLVKDAFRCEYRGKIEVKGKGKPGMYFVTSPNGSKGPPLPGSDKAPEG